MHTNNRVSPNPLSDEILIARVAQSDKAAHEILYDRHAATVLGILVRILGDRAAVEDLLQRTFWQVWQSADTYSSQSGSFTSWLYRIARKLAMDAMDQGSIHTAEIMEQALSSPNAKQTQNIVEHLPYKQRQILEMAYFYGQTRQQIAKATGETLATVQSLARQGLQKINEELKNRENKR